MSDDDDDDDDDDDVDNDSDVDDNIDDDEQKKTFLHDMLTQFNTKCSHLLSLSFVRNIHIRCHIICLLNKEEDHFT